MEQEPEELEPKQHTPRTGQEIPVPKREDFFRDLGKVARPRKAPADDEDESREDSV